MQQENLLKPTSQNNSLYRTTAILLAHMFLLMNILFVIVTLFSLIDPDLELCSYYFGYDIIRIVHYECPFIFSWYGSYASFLILLPFISLFFVFAPEIVFIAFYGITLKKLLAMYKDSQETYSRKKLKQLLFSMLALPFLFTVSTYAVVTNINTPRAVQNEHSSQQTEKTNTEILQNRQLDVNTKNTKDQGVSLLETTKNRPDYCSEAPESVHLIKPTSTFSGPQLQFPAGFWAGVGGVQVSPENSWDGVATNTNDIYYSNSNLVNFSSSSYSKLHKNSLRNDTPNTEVGQKYDIWVSTIKHETIPTVINNHTKKPIENVQKYTFIDGIYYELYKNGVSLDYSTGGSFDVSSSTRADRQPCLTVTVRPSK